MQSSYGYNGEKKTIGGGGGGMKRLLKEGQMVEEVGSEGGGIKLGVNDVVVKA